MVIVRDTFPDFLGKDAKRMPKAKRTKAVNVSKRPAKPSSAGTPSYKSGGRMGKLSS